MSKTKNRTPFLFMSWSGAQSQELAYVLRDLLCSVFHIPTTEVFISDSDLWSKDSWLEKIRTNASNSKIEIACITRDNCERPWIHYELGICSYVENEVRKTIIPVCFNMAAKEIPSHLEMITYNQMICVDSRKGMSIGSIPYFKEMAKRLIYRVNKSITEYPSEDYSKYNFEGNQDMRIDEMFYRQIETASKKMKKIYVEFGEKDVFISRPMQGISKDVAYEIEKILMKVKRECKDREMYFAEIGNTSINMPLSRIDIIKECQNFIMIYPKIHNEDDKIITPSSCFIELGAAVALGKRIKIYAQEGSSLPAFMDKKYKQFSIEYYTNFEKLHEMLLDYINKKKTNTR